MNNIEITTTDTLGASVGVSAVTSPAWLPWLQNVSEVAAMLAPILGAVWLIVQIYSKVREQLRKRKDED